MHAVLLFAVVTVYCVVVFMCLLGCGSFDGVCGLLLFAG